MEQSESKRVEGAAEYVRTKFPRTMRKLADAEAALESSVAEAPVVPEIRGCVVPEIAGMCREAVGRFSEHKFGRLQAVAESLDGGTVFEFEMFCERLEYGKFGTMTPAERENARRLAMFGLAWVLEATCRGADEKSKTA